MTARYVSACRHLILALLRRGVEDLCGLLQSINPQAPLASSFTLNENQREVLDNATRPSYSRLHSFEGKARSEDIVLAASAPPSLRLTRWRQPGPASHPVLAVRHGHTLAHAVCSSRCVRFVSSICASSK